MTPQQLAQFSEMQETLKRLMRAEDVSFLNAIKRNARLVNQPEIDSQLSNLRLSSLADVEDTDSATTGQVLKKTATTWKPGTDLT